MDFLKSAMDQYQNSRKDDDDDHKDDVHKALQKDIRPADESDIHQAMAAHDKVYKKGIQASDEELGNAAGAEAFRTYEQNEKSNGDAGGQSQLLQMAMAEAMKLFSGKGGAASGSDKSTVVQSAVAMAMKLFMGKSGTSSGSVNQILAMFTSGGKGGEGSGSGQSAALMGMLENPQVAGMLKKFM
ncbi:hypothetical protein BG004_000032 [Podila humilis]|nr:hypothetical protein BG004_000032 [Podila humilis]